MAIVRIGFAFLLCASAAIAADLELLPGKEKATKVNGSLVSIDEKEVVFLPKDSSENLKAKLENIVELKINTPPANFRIPNAWQVVLSDGTTLYCKPVEGFRVFDKNKVELTLMSDVKVQVPLAQLRMLIKEAHQPVSARDPDAWGRCLLRTEYTSKAAKEEDERNKNNKNRKLADVHVTRSEEIEKDKKVTTFSAVRGRFPGTGTGTVLDFDRYIKGEKDIRTETIDIADASEQALIFAKLANPDAAPSVCRLYDMDGNQLNVAKVTCKDAATLVVETVVGARVQYPLKNVARLDFSKGKIVYISDLLDSWIKTNGSNDENIDIEIEKKPDDGRLDRIRCNVNLEDKDLTLRPDLRGKPETYAKGLALPAPTQLLYKLDGKFDEFSAILGVDDTVTGDSNVKVTLDFDDNKKSQAVYKVTRSAVVELDPETGKEKGEARRVLAIRKNIKDVRKMRIKVEPMEGLLPYGHHVNLANAVITKESK